MGLGGSTPARANSDRAAEHSPETGKGLNEYAQSRSIVFEPSTRFRRPFQCWGELLTSFALELEWPPQNASPYELASL